MSEQPEAFQLAAELERTDSPLRRPDTVALRAAELLRQQWRDIEHARAVERERAIEHTHAVGEKVLLIREQHAEIERLRRALKFIKNLTVEIDGCPASAFQTEGWMREIAREALEDKP